MRRRREPVVSCQYKCCSSMRAIPATARYLRGAMVGVWKSMLKQAPPNSPSEYLNNVRWKMRISRSKQDGDCGRSDSNVKCYNGLQICDVPSIVLQFEEDWENGKVDDRTSSAEAQVRAIEKNLSCTCSGRSRNPGCERGDLIINYTTAHTHAKW